MTKTLHELAKEYLNKANVEILAETGKLKKEEPAKVVEEAKAPKLTQKDDQDKKIPNSLASYRDRIYKAKTKQLRGDPAKDGIAAAKKDDEERDNIKEDDVEESVTRKHFQQVADVIKSHPDAAKRKELAQHHSEIFAKQNPRFDKKKFHKAADAELDEAEVNELSTKTLKKYVKHAAQDAYDKGNDSEAAYHQGTREQEVDSHRRGQNRISGIIKATDKLSKKSVKEDEAIVEARPSQWKATGPKGKPKSIHAVGNIKGVDGKTFHYDKDGKKIYEGVNGEHGPDDDEDQLDRIERKKQKEPPFEPDKKKSTNWTSAKSKANHLARAAMKKMVAKRDAEKKKVNEDEAKGPRGGNLERLHKTHAKKDAERKIRGEKMWADSKIKVGGKYVFGNTKGNVAHIEGDKTKKLTKEDDVQEISKEKLGQYEVKANRSVHRMLSGSESEVRKNKAKVGKRVLGIVQAKNKIYKKSKTVSEMDNDSDYDGARRNAAYDAEKAGFNARRKREAKDRAKEASGKRKKEPYLPFGKALPRHRLGQNHMTETEINELSKEKVRKYHDTSNLEIGKASAHRTFAMHDQQHNPSPDNKKKYEKAINTVRKRIAGRALSKKRLEAK